MIITILGGIFFYIMMVMVFAYVLGFLNQYFKIQRTDDKLMLVSWIWPLFLVLFTFFIIVDGVSLMVHYFVNLGKKHS